MIYNVLCATLTADQPMVPEGSAIQSAIELFPRGQRDANILLGLWKLNDGIAKRFGCCESNFEPMLSICLEG